MRLLKGLLIAIGVLLIPSAIVCLVASNNAYNAGGPWLAQAIYVGQCVPRPVPPTTAAQCGDLSHNDALTLPNGAKLPAGIQITDKESLLAGFSTLNATGSALIGLSATIAALAGIALALAGLISIRQRV
jgi:hypothetical protein